MPLSTTYAVTPLKRPMEEDEEEKSKQKEKEDSETKRSPVHAPIFTVSVEVDGVPYEVSGPSKKHVVVKVLQGMRLPTGVEEREQGDESAEETNQKPVAAAAPPMVKTVFTPSAAVPSEQTKNVKKKGSILTKHGKNPVMELNEKWLKI
ncbi:hypothetical protein JD844_026193 [Phrynosoma platyrhinos]|uniref:Uncharacterized protein n=1 Tax=Phrynosoma platyrhinos TaxID=52577 RepID=A0ABQ7SEK2_PHRPL|nr:hypothetical protein JD844_026193 [Phrynosoma platyrhinos]